MNRYEKNISTNNESKILLIKEIVSYKDSEGKEDRNKKRILFYDYKENLIVDKKEKYKRNQIIMVNDNKKFKSYKVHSYKGLYKNFGINKGEKIFSEFKDKNIALYINKIQDRDTLNNKIYISNKNNRLIENFIYNKLIKSSIEKLQKSIPEDIYTIKSFEASLLDRIVVGLGGANINETDITLHHTYGIPYIPGQAIKGVVRNYIIRNKHLANSEIESEQKAMKDKKFKDIFGGTDEQGKSYAGKVIFFDAFPINECVIEKDIMTPHHSEYYTKEGVFPQDSDSVVPIQFLVATGNKDKLKFQINIAIDSELEEDTITDLVDNLRNALMDNGIGAKTAVGYGYFESVKEVTKSDK